MQTPITTPISTPTQIDQNAAFQQVLQDKLMSTSDMISSANTGIETAIQSAIGKVEQSTKAGTAAVESSYNREIGYRTEGLNRELTAARERGVGINTSDVAYKAMANEADKQIKDLEQRKQELMLQNDAAGAAKVSDLILQTSKMKIDAMQQTFGNLLAAGGFNLQVQASQRADKQLSLAEKSQMYDTALQYGVTVKPGDTYESVVQRAGIYGGQMAAAKLAKELAQGQEARAKAAEALAKDSFNINDISQVNGLKQIILNNPQAIEGEIAKSYFSGKVKLADNLNKVKELASAEQLKMIPEEVNRLVASGNYSGFDELYASMTTPGKENYNYYLDRDTSAKEILKAYEEAVKTENTGSTWFKKFMQNADSVGKTFSGTSTTTPVGSNLFNGSSESIFSGILGR